MAHLVPDAVRVSFRDAMHLQGSVPAQLWCQLLLRNLIEVAAAGHRCFRWIQPEEPVPLPKPNCIQGTCHRCRCSSG